jgi:predicted AAA+ superfamily ATPase
MTILDHGDPVARLKEMLAGATSDPIPSGTMRRVHGALGLPGKATAVVGTRRAGKTTFVHLERRRKLEAGVPRERLVYLSLEDERLAGLRADQLGEIVDEYYRRFPATRGRETVHWAFDEVQNVPGWERFVRRILDSERVDVTVSGSSAALLSREVATAMRGRAWEVVIYPFAFDEFLRHRGLPLPADPGFLAAAERSAVEAAFMEYVSCGGFPEAQGLDVATSRRLLAGYVDVAILRDVMERHGVTQVTALRRLVRHLLGNPASSFSVEKFYASLRSQGVRIAKDTLHDMMSCLEDCFLVRTVWMESASERQRMVNPRKVYPIDPGLIRVFDRGGIGSTGHALEAAVLIELERRLASVSYVRTASGREVDFLARDPAGGEALVQVCADPSDAGTRERALRALEEAGRSFPRAARLLLTLTRPRGRPAGGRPPGIDV